MGSSIRVVLQSLHTCYMEQVATGEDGQGAGLEGGKTHWAVGVELVQCLSSELLPRGGV